MIFLYFLIWSIGLALFVVSMNSRVALTTKDRAYALLGVVMMCVGLTAMFLQ